MVRYDYTSSLAHAVDAHQELTRYRQHSQVCGVFGLSVLNINNPKKYFPIRGLALIRGGQHRRGYAAIGEG